MSEQKRQLVESALKGTHIQSRTSNPETTQGAAIPVEQATVQLQALGFTADQAAMASAAVCRSDDISMSNALDWLCLHLPTEALPPAFAPGDPLTTSHGHLPSLLDSLSHSWFSG